MAPLSDQARKARNVARHRTIVTAGAASPTAAMLDRACEGGRLARTDGGEADGMRAGGPLDPDSAAGRRVRLAGWIVTPDHPAALGADQVADLLRAAGIIPGSASTDDAVEAYARLALVADREASATAEREDLAREAAWWADREQLEAEQTFERDATRERLGAWLARLVCPAKFEYAAALVASWEAGTPRPDAPAAAWAPKCSAKFDRIIGGAW